ncbi:unnamed protein product [Rhodiola kirilowii]
MGSGDWFKTLTNSKKARGSRKQKKGSSTNVKLNGFVWKHNNKKSFTIFANATCDSDGNRWVLGRPIEEVAATRIQTAYRAYWARKSLRRLKGIIRLQLLTQGDSVKRQSVSTLNHLHTWGKIQDQIKARRLCMVVEGRLRQKKLENQLKLDAKLHDAEAEWSCTAESMNEIIGKIHTREEATVKRERAMAYAFTHQWRANSSLNQLMGNSELGKSNWGWSWMERWIAARPWESRISTTPKTAPATPTAKAGKTKTSLPSTPTKSSPKPTQSGPKGSTPKSALSNGKGSTTKIALSSGKGVATKPRRLSYPPSVKPASKDITVETKNTKKEQEPNTN